MRTKRLVQTLAFLPAALLMAGCIHSKRIDTVYLDPEGALDWNILIKDIRSADGDADQRQEQEASFLRPFLDGDSNILLAAQHLGAYLTSSQVVRADRPYLVMAEARFASLEALAQEMVRVTGCPGEAYLEYGEGRRSLVVRVTLLDEEEISDEAREEVTVIGAFLEGFREMEFVLTDGAFVSAVGFEVEEGSSVARLDLEGYLEREWEPGDVFELSLTWTVPASR